MNCRPAKNSTFREIDSRWIHTCQACGAVWASKREQPEQTPNRCKSRPPGGPGSELAALLKSLGIRPNAGCGCDFKAEQMDDWGVNGCREHRAEIVAWMRAAYETTGWVRTIAVASRAAIIGLAWSIDLADPLGSLVDEAIRRAIAKDAKG